MKNLFYLFAIIISTSQFTSCKDKCQDSDCLNGGRCYKGQCWCVKGYKGVNCETETRAPLIGTYTGGYTCTDSTVAELLKLTIERHDNGETYNMIKMQLTDSNGFIIFTYYPFVSRDGSFHLNDYSNIPSMYGELTGDKVTYVISYKDKESNTIYKSCNFEGIKE